MTTAGSVSQSAGSGALPTATTLGYGRHGGWRGSSTTNLQEA